MNQDQENKLWRLLGRLEEGQINTLKAIGHLGDSGKAHAIDPNAHPEKTKEVGTRFLAWSGFACALTAALPHILDLAERLLHVGR